MQINAKMYPRWMLLKELRNLYFIDCNFNTDRYLMMDYITEPQKIKHIEVSFYKSRSYNNKDDDNVAELLMEQPMFGTAESFSFNGFRLYRTLGIIKKSTNLKKIQLTNFWNCEFKYLRDNSQHEVEIYLQNLSYMKDHNWKGKFPNHRGIYVGQSIEGCPKYVDGSHRNFLRKMRVSGKKMISNETFAIGIEPENVDPLFQIPAEIHDLIFQHFNAKDAVNMREVSLNWNEFGKSSKVLMNKMRFCGPSHLSSEDEQAMRKACRLYSTVTLFSFGWANRFCEHVRDITIVMDGDYHEVNLNKQTYNEFPNLESLTIGRKKQNRQYRRCNNQQLVVKSE